MLQCLIKLLIDPAILLCYIDGEIRCDIPARRISRGAFPGRYRSLDYTMTSALEIGHARDACLSEERKAEQLSRPSEFFEIYSAIRARFFFPLPISSPSTEDTIFDVGKLEQDGKLGRHRQRLLIDARANLPDETEIAQREM